MLFIPFSGIYSIAQLASLYGRILENITDNIMMWKILCLTSKTLGAFW